MGLYKQYDDYGRSRILPILENCKGFTNIEPQMDEKARVDILATGYTRNGEMRKYAIECKDRPKYNSTDYGKDEDKQGWIIEDEKLKYLLALYKEDGYIPIYAMSFKDNKVFFWNLSKIDFDECKKTDYKEWNKTTVEYNGTYKKKKITLMNSDCVCKKEIK